MHDSDFASTRSIDERELIAIYHRPAFPPAPISFDPRENKTEYLRAKAGALRPRPSEPRAQAEMRIHAQGRKNRQTRAQPPARAHARARTRTRARKHIRHARATLLKSKGGCNHEGKHAHNHTKQQQTYHILFALVPDLTFESLWTEFVSLHLSLMLSLLLSSLLGSLLSLRAGSGVSSREVPSREPCTN